MRTWTYIETQEHGPFSLILDWTYEDSALSDCFDETIFDLEDMIDRCNRYVDTHYIARVRAFYDGVEMGASILGSCYARDCNPAEDMASGLGGYLEDMIDEALTEARTRSKEMLNRLKKDFLET